MQVSISNPYSPLYPQSNERPNLIKRSVIWIKIYCKAFRETCRQHPIVAAIASMSLMIMSVTIGIVLGLAFTASTSIVAVTVLASVLPFAIAEGCAIAASMKLIDSARKVIEEWRKQHYSTIPTNQKVALIFQSAEDHNGAFKSESLPQPLEDNYRPIFKTISSLKEMQQVVDQVKSQGNLIHMLWINAHGSPQSLQLGKRKYLTAQKNRKFTYIANQLESKAPIVFSSCLSGAPGGVAASLARSIGDRTIYASKFSFSGSQLSVKCKKGFKFSIKQFRWEDFKPTRAKCLTKIGLIILEILHFLSFGHLFARESGISYAGPQAATAA